MPSEPISDVHGYGLAGARPAAGIVGRYYFATDTLTLYRDNGTTWDTQASGGGVSDHGALTGLADDDHPQYATDTDLTTHAATPHGGGGASDRLLGQFVSTTSVVVNPNPVGATVIPGMSVTVTIPTSMDIEIRCAVALDSGSSAEGTRFQIWRDSTVIWPLIAGSGFWSPAYQGDTGSQVNRAATMTAAIVALAPGTYTFKLMGDAYGGTSAQTYKSRYISVWDVTPGTPSTDVPIEVDYAQRTTDLTVTATTEAGADTLVSGASKTYDGSTVVDIEVFTPGTDLQNVTTAASLILSLWEDSTPIGWVSIHSVGQTVNNDSRTQPMASIRRTPSAGAHTYHVKAHKTGTVTTATVHGGAGGSGAFAPAFIRIKRTLTMADPEPGGMTLIQEIVLAVDTAYIEFTGIPATYKDLEARWVVRSNHSGVDNLLCRVGSGSVDTSNYAIFAPYTGTSAGTVNVASEVHLFAGIIPANNNAAGFFGSGELVFQDYASTAKSRNCQGNSGYYDTPVNAYFVTAWGTWKNTSAAIDVIRFYPSLGSNLKAGSKIALYGRN